MRPLRRVLALGAVVAALVAVDSTARAVAERAISHQLAVRSSRPGGANQAHIRSFPFLGRLLLGGQVARVDFTVELAGDGAGGLAVLDGRLDGVTVSRGSLLREQRVRVTGLRHGAAGLDLSERLISSMAHLPLQVEAEGISVVVSGVKVPATVSVTAAGRLRLELAGVRGFDLGDARIDRYRAVLVCAPTVTTRHDFVRLACGFDTIPPALRGAAG